MAMQKTLLHRRSIVCDIFDDIESVDHVEFLYIGYVPRIDL